MDLEFYFLCLNNKHERVNMGLIYLAMMQFCGLQVAR